MSIKVAILDDHPLILKGLENILATTENISLSGTYYNGTDLLDSFKNIIPDILLLDIQMPGRSGDEWITDILQHCPDLKIIAYTNIDNLLYVFNMLKLGAKGYILKSAHPQYLMDCIRDVDNGLSIIDSTLEERYKEYLHTIKRETYLHPKLTEREKEILQLITDGLSSKQIADRLFISIRTVEFYRLNILLKLDANNTAMLVKKAIKSGLAR
ncbi:MAG: response regulator transcription factor [Taibaiella sp.]|jgi:two-component system secretion response regulator SsrB